MTNPPVKLPPIKLHKGPSYTYVFTYQGVWVPAIKDEDGNIIKKGYSRVVNRKTIGKIDDGKHTGVIRFYDTFLDDYPELKDYSVVRNSDGSMSFNKISDLSIDNPADHEQIYELIEKQDYDLNTNGKVIKSADNVPMCSNPADIFEYAFNAKRKVLQKTPIADAISTIVRTKKAGAIVYLDHLSLKTGVRSALIKTFNETKNKKPRDAIKFANYIETVVYNMLISGENTYEGLPKFCSEHVLAEGVSGNRTTFLKYINQIDVAFIDRFHKNFIQEYFKGNAERIIKDGLVVIIDGSPLEHKNRDRMYVSSGRSKDGTFKNQINVQFVCDADKNGLPIFYDMFDGRANDVSTLGNVLQKFASYDVSIANLCVLADRGYPSEENICTLLRNGKTFLFNCRRGEGTVVQEVIDQAISQNIYGNDSFSELKSSTTSCASFTRTYRYDETPVQDKRACKKATAEVRYHVYFDSEIHFSAVKKLKDTLCKLSDAVENGKKLTPKDEELLKKYSNYDLSKYVEGKPNLSPKFLPTAIDASTKYEGFQVLMTNDLTLSSAKALKIYKSRPKVETSIQDNKQHLQGNTTKAKSDAGIQSKIFLQHIASIFKAAMRHDISDARANCKGKYADAFRSNRAVLDNLNGIIVDEYAKGIVYKPIVGKHAHILKCLGVPLPKSMLSLTKYGETCEVNATVDDELYDE